jgi:hypothetical protein
MNIKENIRKVLMEDRSERLKSKIINMIKNVKIDTVVNSVGGDGKFTQLLDLNNVDQFLNMFKNMEVVKHEGVNYKSVKFKDGMTYFVFTGPIIYVDINITDLVSFLKDSDYNSKHIIMDWFNEEYGTTVTTMYSVPNNLLVSQ